MAELVSGKQFTELKTCFSLKIKPKLDFYPENFPRLILWFYGLELLFGTKLAWTKKLPLFENPT
jgi:hypothetical protein